MNSAGKRRACTFEATSSCQKSRVNPDEALSQIEKQIVHTLSQNGRTMTVSEFRSVCLRMGLNQTTCYLYLVHSPFIAKYGHNRYGLIGSGEEILSGVA